MHQDSKLCSRQKSKRSIVPLSLIISNRLVDGAFSRRLHPIHVEMPTTEDIHEFLRRYFLQRENFITTSALLKMAEKLKGASFDDINTFLGIVNSLNGAKMTDECQHFRETYSNDVDFMKWCACLQNDP